MEPAAIEICERCQFENTQRASYCGGCGASLQGSKPPSLPAEESGERRQITLLFCDIVGSSKLAERLDAEDYREVVSSYHRRCDEVAQAFGGHVAQYLGDGTLIYFGYPKAFEDSARRAVLTGLRLVEAAARLAEDLPQLGGIGLPVRVGIHTGSVVIGWIGGRGRREMLAVGDAPNLTARIQDFAEPGTVIVSQSTQRLIHGDFQLLSLPPRTPKGFSEPVALFHVVGLSGTSERFAAARPAGQGPLVGRDAEQRVLREAWRRAGAGEAPVVMLVGEPGIGKTRNVGALRDGIAGDVHVELLARCSPMHQATALYPFIRCLEGHLELGSAASVTYAEVERKLDADGIEDVETRRVLSLLLAVAPDVAPVAAAVPQLLRIATFQALRTWLGCIARRRALLIVEDLHWADASTLALLGELTSDSEPAGLFTVLTARPEFANPWPASERFRVLNLARLTSTEEFMAIVRHVAGRETLPQALLDQIAQRSLGVPLYVEEMTKALLASGSLDDPSAAQRAIPETLYDSLASRIDRLGTARGVAQLAAVIGQEFRHDVLLEVWTRSDRGAANHPQTFSAQLERLVESELFSQRGVPPEATYEFKHVLLHQATYDTLLRSRRRELHGIVADSLVQRFPHLVKAAPQLVAEHYSKAESHREATEYFREAALQAMSRSAHPEAIQALGAALAELRKQPESRERSRRELELSCTLGLEFVQTLGFAAKQVEDTYGRAMALCDELGGEVGRTPEVLYGVWLVHFVRGELGPIERLAVHFRELAERSADPSVLLMAHASLGNFHFYRAEYENALGHLRVAGDLVSLADPKKQHAGLMQRYRFEGLLYAPIYRAWCELLTGKGPEAFATWSSALDVATRLEDPYILAQVRAIGATLLREMGRLEEAKALADEVRTGAAAFSFWYACATIVSGWILVKSGDAAAGMPQLREALAILRAIGANVPYPYFLSFLAEAQILVGELEEAENGLTEALSMADRNIDRNFAPELLCLRGDICLLRGDRAAAETSFRHAMNLTRGQGASFLHLKAALRLARLLAPSEARELVLLAREGVNMPESEAALEAIRLTS